MTQSKKRTGTYQQEWYPKVRRDTKDSIQSEITIITTGKAHVEIGRPMERTTGIQMQMMGKETIREIEVK